MSVGVWRALLLGWSVLVCFHSSNEPNECWQARLEAHTDLWSDWVLDAHHAHAGEAAEDVVLVVPVGLAL